VREGLEFIQDLSSIDFAAADIDALSPSKTRVV
jgi:hypothetical protein